MKTSELVLILVKSRARSRELSMLLQSYQTIAATLGPSAASLMILKCWGGLEKKP